MPWTITIVFGMYVVSLKSPGAPTACQGCSCFSNSGPSAKPSAGRTNAAVATAPVRWTVPVMKRRRVTVSPSNAPGMPRSAVYLDLASLRSAMAGRETLAPPKSTPRTPSAPGRSADRRRVAGNPARRRPQALGGAGIARPGRRLRGLQVAVGAPADGRRAGHPDRLGELRPALRVGLRAERDDVGELGDRVEVAQRGEPREAERVEVVAGEQHQVAVVLAQQAPGGVVQEIALADRLDDERDLLLPPHGARAGGGARAERRVALALDAGGALGVRCERRGEQPALRAQRLGQAAQRVRRRHARAHSEANAAAAASTVRSTCSGPWASDGNHASNCDGGG